MKSHVEPGIYRHHRGGLYRVLLTAIESTNAREGVEVVVYVSLTTGLVRVRTVAEFKEYVEWPDVFDPLTGRTSPGGVHARFELCSEAG